MTLDICNHIWTCMTDYAPYYYRCHKCGAKKE